MNREQILSEVANSDWQPKFEFTDNLDAVVDDILRPHEDYFLGLRNKVKEIIQQEIDTYNFHVENQERGLYSELNPYQYRITFADVCNWQKELFEHKGDKIAQSHRLLYLYAKNQMPDLNENHPIVIKSRNAVSLPNQHITLGLRTTEVKVGNWTPPAPMFLEELKEMCFPIKIENGNIYLPVNSLFLGGIFSSKEDVFFSKEENQSMLLLQLTEWYKIFETAHFFEDLNGRLGGIVINILSFLLTGKYLIKSR